MQPRRTEEDAVAIQCPCGHGIYCILERHGERLGSMEFFDDEPLSSTLGERVEHCPSCGKRLAIHTLLLSETLQG